ncbi:MAG: cyclic nucleotide-binding domain-containing protein [Candidatus Limnocylindrales bacterium]
MVGTRGLVIELQGALSFLAPDEIAVAVGAARAEPGGLDLLVLDVRRVERIDPAAVDLLGSLVAALSRSGMEVLVSGRFRPGPNIAAIERAMARDGGGLLLTTDDLDNALEMAEDRLLAEPDVQPIMAVALAEQALVRGLSLAQLEIMASHLERLANSHGSSIVVRGALSDALFLIERGRASVSIEIPGQGRRRLSTLGPGITFGEAALLDGGLRTADVGADSEVVCLALSVAFEALLVQHPEVTAALLRNLLRSVGATAARLTREVAVLAS